MHSDCSLAHAKPKSFDARTKLGTKRTARLPARDYFPGANGMAALALKSTPIRTRAFIHRLSQLHTIYANGSSYTTRTAFPSSHMPSATPVVSDMYCLGLPRLASVSSSTSSCACFQLCTLKHLTRCWHCNIYIYS